MTFAARARVALAAVLTSGITGHKDPCHGAVPREPLTGGLPGVEDRLTADRLAHIARRQMNTRHSASPHDSQEPVLIGMHPATWEDVCVSESALWHRAGPDSFKGIGVVTNPRIGTGYVDLFWPDAAVTRVSIRPEDVTV